MAVSGSYPFTIYSEYIDEDLSWFPATISLSGAAYQDYYDGFTYFSDDFSYPDDTTATDLMKWRNFAGDATIQGNKLRCAIESGNTRDGFTFNYTIIGDFDMSMDYDIIAGPSTNGWYGGFRCGVGSNLFQMLRAYRTSGGQVYQTWYTGASWSQQVATGDTNGKLRIQRIGSTIYGYYDDSGWQQLDSWAIGSGELTFQIYLDGFDTVPTATLDYDNFTITADKIVPTFPEKTTYFTDTDGSILYTEVEYVNFTNEQATFHTAVPTVSAGDNTPLTFNWDFAGRDYNVRELPKEDYSDSFTGANGSSPDTDKWFNIGAQTEIQNNKLNQVLGSGAPNSDCRTWFIDAPDIVGNFDIQVDYDLITKPNSSYWGGQLVVTDADGEGCSHVVGWYGRQQYWTWVNNDGWNADIVSHDPGKLRVTRVGNTWTALHWDGGTWQTNTTWTTATATPLVDIRLILNHGDGSPACEISWDNFKVNNVVYDTTEVGDTFTGTNGDPVDEMKWRQAGNIISNIQSNTLEWDSNEATDQNEYNIYRSLFSDDFDIQVDYEIFNEPTPASSLHYAIFQLITSANDGYISRAKNNSGNREYIYSGFGDAWTSFVTTDNTGKLRFTRVNGTITGYHWNAGSTQWEWNGNAAGHVFTTTDTNDVEVRLWIKQEANARWNGNLNNFQINGADSITGWTEDTGEHASQTVWDSNFKIVTHLADTPTGSADDILDSTSNEYHGTSYNMGAGNSGSNEFGKYLTFDGSNEFIDFGDAFYSDTITIEAVSNVTSFTGGQPRMVVLKRNEIGTSTTNTNKSEWGNQYIDADTVSLQGWDANQDIPVGTSINSATDLTGIEIYQAHGCETAPGGNPFFSQINDDTSDGVRSTDEVVRDQNAAWQIGTRSNNNNSRWFLGDIREVRISNISRSEAWRKATYYSLFGTLYDEAIQTLTIQDMNIITSSDSLTDIVLSLIIQNLNILTSADSTEFTQQLEINNLNIHSVLRQMNFPPSELSSINTTVDMRKLLRILQSKTPARSITSKTIKRILSQYNE